jgi:hypothetical protein
MAAHRIELLRGRERRARLAEAGTRAFAVHIHSNREVIRTVESAFRIGPRLVRKRELTLAERMEWSRTSPFNEWRHTRHRQS